jgi:hypothetical protein
VSVKFGTFVCGHCKSAHQVRSTTAFGTTVRLLLSGCSHSAAGYTSELSGFGAERESETESETEREREKEREGGREGGNWRERERERDRESEGDKSEFSGFGAGFGERESETESETEREGQREGDRERERESIVVIVCLEQAFSHRIKSIGMSTFTAQEVELAGRQGNEFAQVLCRELSPSLSVMLILSLRF